MSHKSRRYNGHSSWNAWNVALWIGNDESSYRHGLDCIKAARRESSRRVYSRAAEMMRQYLPEKTPDGAVYSFASVRHALAGLE